MNDECDPIKVVVERISWMAANKEVKEIAAAIIREAYAGLNDKIEQQEDELERLRAVVIEAAAMLQYGAPEPPNHICGGPNSCCDTSCQEHAAWSIAVCRIQAAANAAKGK